MVRTVMRTYCVRAPLAQGVIPSRCSDRSSVIVGDEPRDPSGEHAPPLVPPLVDLVDFEADAVEVGGGQQARGRGGPEDDVAVEHPVVHRQGHRTAPVDEHDPADLARP